MTRQLERAATLGHGYRTGHSGAATAGRDPASRKLMEYAICF